MGCRYVVIGTDTVTKYGCPASARSGGQNLAEMQQWERVKGTPLERYFVPVIDAAPDGSWLVMPRVQTIAPGRANHRRAVAFRDMVALQGYSESDVQTDNIGEMDGRTVFLDYGFPGYVKGMTGSQTCDGCVYCSDGSGGREVYSEE